MPLKAKRKASRTTAPRKKQAASKPAGLLGLGPFSLAILKRAGITTRAQLEKKGAVAAFLAAKAIEPKVSLNLLWGIAGAITDTHWSKLPADYRSSLLLEYDAHCDVRRTLEKSAP